MATNAVVTGTLAVPQEDGKTPAPVDLGQNFAFTQKADLVCAYDDAVTDSAVALGTLADSGARGLLVKCTAGSCSIKFNSGTQAWPLSAGGYLLYMNPAQGFPTAAAITTGGAASVKIIAVG